LNQSISLLHFSDINKVNKYEAFTLKCFILEICIIFFLFSSNSKHLLSTITYTKRIEIIPNRPPSSTLPWKHVFHQQDHSDCPRMWHAYVTWECKHLVAKLSTHNQTRIDDFGKCDIHLKGDLQRLKGHKANIKYDYHVP
jgi:hypothetical protein